MGILYQYKLKAAGKTAVSEAGVLDAMDEIIEFEEGY
jgi:hypothetical protein